MLIVESNKSFFETTGWKCAIEDIIDLYLPTLKGADLKFKFVWKSLDAKKGRFSGYHTFNHITKFHNFDVVLDGESDLKDVVDSILHELRHAWQFNNGDTIGTARFKGNAYWNHPKEVDARNFAKKHLNEAFEFVKEYLA